MDTEEEDYDRSLRRTAEQRVGRTLQKKYTLERVIGVGGMAAVYVGVHRNGHRVAIKLLHPEISLVPDLRARFLREGYVANKVGHPGVVRVLDDDATDDGAVYLVMDLLEGATLADLLKHAGGTLPPEELVPLVIQLLEVLAAAHNAGVIHRDIKPENLFIEVGGDVKVLDFGIARIAHESRTRTGRVLGTPEFMPPEQAKGKAREVDAQSDLYAVGAVLFRALTGRTVHQAETPEMSAILAATERPPAVSSVCPSLPENLASVVDRALTPEKEARWPSADAMREALLSAFPAERWRIPHLIDASLLAETRSMVASHQSFGGLSTPAGRLPIRSRSLALAVLSALFVGATIFVFYRAGGERKTPSPARSLSSPAPAREPSPEPSSAIPKEVIAPVAASGTSAASEPRARPDAGASPTTTTGRSGRKHGTVPGIASQGPASNCDPPWVLNSAGTREYRLECFKK